MDRRQLLDLYFVDARARLIDIAAFLDRLERGEADEDFRAEAFRRALKELEKPGADRARRSDQRNANRASRSGETRGGGDWRDRSADRAARVIREIQIA